MRTLPALTAPAALVCTLLCAPLALVGCENKLSQSNYDRITVGMSRAQVFDILGNGELQSGGAGTGAGGRVGEGMLGDVRAAQRQADRTAKAAGVDLKPEEAPKVDTKPTFTYVWTETGGPSGTSEISITYIDDMVVNKNAVNLK